MSTIVDGDTVDVRMTDGAVETVRLIGTNAPEAGECFADRATATLFELIPPGTELTMTADVSDRDRFGRLLRYLWVEQTSVNEEMVRRGAAVARRYPPDTALAELLEAAEREAEAARLGLWSPNACGVESEAALVVVTVRFDAPGDDNENLNEEWVQIRNDGQSQVDMTGWAIRDESSSHRYAFPASFTIPPGATVTVRTGCGEDAATVLHWCNQGSAVWNNDGDTAFLLDPAGNVHYSYRY